MTSNECVISNDIAIIVSDCFGKILANLHTFPIKLPNNQLKNKIVEYYANSIVK